MKNRIRILVTSDVHGALFGTDYANGGFRPAGLVRMKTLIDSLRDENTLLIDNGDVLEGNPILYHHYHVARDEENPVAIAMSMMNYDYFNLGNHDFNYGVTELKKFLSAIHCGCITGNVSYKGIPFGPKYLIRYIAGKKIAIFGITTQYVPHWEDPAHIKDVTFTDAYEFAVQTVKEIKEKDSPDAIVGIYHGGFERNRFTGEPTSDTDENEGYAIMRDIDGLDLLVMGHQHEHAEGVLFGTAFTETKSRAAEIAVHDIDTETMTVTTSIVPVTAETAEDPELLGRLLPYESAVQEWLNQKLGEANIDMTVTDNLDARIHKAPVVTFMNEAIMSVSGAEIASTALFQGAKGLKPVITMRDLMATYMFPNTLVVKKVTGAVLKEYLEKTAEFWTIRDGKIAVADRSLPTHPLYHNYDMADGIEYTVKISNPVGSRIISLTRNGVPVKPEEEFTLAVNNYRAAGGGEFDMIKNAPTVKEDARSIVEILAEYLMDHPHVTVAENENITLIP